MRFGLVVLLVLAAGPGQHARDGRAHVRGAAGGGRRD